jgi:hypothetical protein
MEENILNNNKLVLVLCVIFANLTNKVMEKEIENFDDNENKFGCDIKKFFDKDHHVVRKLAIFCMTYIFTRDFKVSLAVSLLFFIINDILLAKSETNSRLNLK